MFGFTSRFRLGIVVQKLNNWRGTYTQNERFPQFPYNAMFIRLAVLTEQRHELQEQQLSTQISLEQGRR